MMFCLPSDKAQESPEWTHAHCEKLFSRLCYECASEHYEHETSFAAVRRYAVLAMRLCLDVIRFPGSEGYKTRRESGGDDKSEFTAFTTLLRFDKVNRS